MKTLFSTLTVNTRVPAWALVFCFLLALSAQSQVSAAIAAVGSKLSTPPPSVEVGDLESNDRIVVFPEGGITLPLSLRVDLTGDASAALIVPQRIPALTEIRSYFVHADQVGDTGSTSLSMALEFDADILGVITSGAGLDASDDVLGVPTTSYPTGVAGRGIAGENSDSIVVNGRTVTIAVTVWAVVDQIRIITTGTASPTFDVRPTFSIDFQGPPLVASWPAGQVVEGSDILTPGDPGPSGPNPPAFGPLPAPGIYIEGASDIGMMQPGINEVDAYSRGNDYGEGIYFSVDEWTVGLPGGVAPNVFSEAANGEASADVFRYGAGIGNRAVGDGDGLAPSGRPGVGLQEPNPAAPGIPDTGHNLDALNAESVHKPDQGPTYFSLDSAFLDTLEGIFNSGTASQYGVSGADVLVKVPGLPVQVYAAANRLGLDRFGVDTDDLDALALRDNGDQEFHKAVDRILFSVRRNSAVIGQLDSLLGIPISEADILTVPTPGAMFPAIYLRAEQIGLGATRSECYSQWDAFAPDVEQQQPRPCDDLDALDMYEKVEIVDLAPEFERADVDASGARDLIDPIKLLVYLILGSYDPPCLDACDYDDNGVVNLGDVIGDLKNQILGTADPAAPAGVCGVDPTPEDGGIDLGCESFPACP